jgi:hypothetical protein
MYTPNSHTFLDIRGSDTVRQPNDKLGNLLDVDHVLVLLVSTFLALVSTKGIDCFSGCLFVWVDWDDLGATSDLKRSLFSYSLPVCRDIP